MARTTTLPPSPTLPDKEERRISEVLLARFVKIVGEKYAITDPQAQEPYLVEMRHRWRGRTPLVLRPGTVAEVSEILKLANETGTPIVPQGGNTGLVGGQLPYHGEILLSLNRLDRIREVDPVSYTITCEAGVTLQRAREAAEAVDRLYPQLLPSEGTCTIGGNLSTNAGGTQAVAYGIARSHVLGIEVVLADGRVLNNLNKLKKDNTGYDLKNLFIGAEGTLGIITAAVLRLVPRPRSVETAWLGVPSPAAAVELLNLANERTAGGVTSFELMARMGVEVVLRHGAGVRYPLREQHPYSVIIELSSQARSGLRAVLEEILAEGHERGLVLDATISDNLEQAKAFWRIREMFGEMQRHEGGSIKHDVSVPIAAIPAFIEEANAAVTKLIPGARPLPFGHVGDGNIHYNITQPVGAEPAVFMQRENEVQDTVFAIVRKFGGSISAEHGIGIAKRERLAEVKDPVALDLMRSLKRMLDPKGILNPGKVL
ncbi:MAG TPA: FAD-binding oxidoreductase [Xanthobacteraceae bacterium]|nr:FAD-binding oxidoreductase [Xanthobacteraceae bacterium]